MRLGETFSRTRGNGLCQMVMRSKVRCGFRSNHWVWQYCYDNDCVYYPTILGEEK